ARVFFLGACLSGHARFLSLEGWLFSEKHIKHSRQLGLLLSSTGIAGSVVGNVPGEGPSLPLRPPAHLHLTSSEGNQFIDLDIDPALFSCDMHLLYFEIAE